MGIKQELAAWDGKSADDIDVIYRSHYGQPGFIDTIIELVKVSEYQKGATWLLKVWLKSGNELEQDQIRAVYGLLKKLEHWESKLHVLQSMPFMPIEKVARKKVEEFLRVTLTNSNKFVRAWSYNGFYELAMQHPEYLNETREFFDMAMRDEAASVKARIRNIMKKGF